MTPPQRAALAAAAAWLAAGAVLACRDDVDPPVPPPLEIAVAKVVQRDQPITLEMVGETRGSVDIPIRARVDGFLEEMHFEEGRNVEKGQILYTIDRAPFEAKVAEVRGHLAEAETLVVKAKADLDRIRPLAEIHAVSQQDLDSAVAQHDAAIGALAAARAQLEQAEIELGYTLVYAPTEGRVGITEVKIGEYVGSGAQSLLNHVSKVDPIRVRFSIDERNYLRLARRLLGERRDRPEGNGQLELVLADDTIHPYRGRAVGTDAAIDPTTGTFTIEADFANPDGIVLAGQFARVRAVIETREGALLVPSRAITELQGDFRVFVVGSDGVVSVRPLELGPRIDRFTIVEKGIAPGESIALEGVQKIKEGMTVIPKLTPLDEAGNVVSTSIAPSTKPGV